MSSHNITDSRQAHWRSEDRFGLGMVQTFPGKDSAIAQYVNTRLRVIGELLLLAALAGIAIALFVGFAPEQAASVPNIF